MFGVNLRVLPMKTNFFLFLLSYQTKIDNDTLYATKWSGIPKRTSRPLIFSLPDVQYVCPKFNDPAASSYKVDQSQLVETLLELKGV